MLCIITHINMFFPRKGNYGVEHRPSKHSPGHGGAGVWDRHRGSEHTVPVLRHVENHLCVAHGGHGPLQHQLPAFRATKVLVSILHLLCIHI